ncbi:MAG: LytTR family DNA-binding domain-containing protein [Cyclobacteriaceae bacterium]
MLVKKVNIRSVQLSGVEKKVLLISFLMLTVFGTIVFFQKYVKYASSVEDFSVTLSLIYNLIIFSTYAFFAPLVIKAVDRYPLRKENQLKNFTLHLSFSVLLGLFHMVLCNLILYSIDLASSPIFARFITKYLTSVIHIHLLTYWIIVALVQKKEWFGSKSNTEIDRFVIKENKYTSFVELDQVHWIEALDHYQKLHTENGFFIYKDSMANLVKRLPAEKFKRVHRSTIVNLSQVQGLRKSEKQLSISLSNGHELPVGKSFKSEVRSLFS